jgi:4'-phosphopantetheinyl transferase EntD
LLRSLLDDDIAMPMGADRRPVLPVGVRASLAHDGDLVVAVVTRSHCVVALGLDLEPVARLAPSEAALVVRPDESGLDASLAFCLKEAAYKAWSAPGRRVLEHHDIKVAIRGDKFGATVLSGKTEHVGAWTRVSERWLALVAHQA